MTPSEPPIVLTGDDATVQDVVERHAGAFAAHGYDRHRIALQELPGQRPFPVFRFLNGSTGMEIAIAFVPAEGGRNGGFSVQIVKPTDRVLEVEDFLAAHDHAESVALFTYRDPATDVRGFAERFVTRLTHLMDTILQPYVDGERFEETPIDWQGYR